jgi:hypothetical protein
VLFKVLLQLYPGINMSPILGKEAVATLWSKRIGKSNGSLFMSRPVRAVVCLWGYSVRLWGVDQTRVKSSESDL